MEKKISQAFIFPNKRERFLFDLSRKSKSNFGEIPKDRFMAICKLGDSIDDSYSLLVSNKLPKPSEIMRIMAKYQASSSCYVLSEYKDYDGVFINLDDALTKLQWNGFPSLIVGLPSGFSHYRGESYASSQPNYFLKPLKRFDGIDWDK